MAESYALPFWINSKDFKKQEENDSLIVSHYKSDLTSYSYEIATPSYDKHYPKNRLSN